MATPALVGITGCWKCTLFKGDDANESVITDVSEDPLPDWIFEFCKTLKLLRFKFSAAVAVVSDIYFKCPGSFEGLGNELPYF